MGGDSLSTQGASGRLMFTVLAGMAEYERELIRSRIQDKLAVKRARGELTGTVPFGWDAVETGEVTPKGVKVRRLVDNPQEQRWILHMRALRDQGTSYDRIARDLNARAVRTKRGKGTIMRLRISDASHAPDAPRSTSKFVSGRWQAGNVAKVLNSKTIQAWLAAKTRRTVSLAASA